MVPTKSAIRILVPQLVFVLALTFLEVNSLKCYICNDCEESHNATHVTECAKEEERCIKMTEKSGQVSRDCGKVETCTRELSEKSPPRPFPSINSPKPEKLQSFKGREKRAPSQLLSPAIKKPKGPPPPEILSLYCCDEDECNSGFSFLRNNAHNLGVLVLPFLSYIFQF